MAKKSLLTASLLLPLIVMSGVAYVLGLGDPARARMVPLTEGILQ